MARLANRVTFEPPLLLELRAELAERVRRLRVAVVMVKVLNKVSQYFMCVSARRFQHAVKIYDSTRLHSPTTPPQEPPGALEHYGVLRPRSSSTSTAPTNATLGVAIGDPLQNYQL